MYVCIYIYIYIYVCMYVCMYYVYYISIYLICTYLYFCGLLLVFSVICMHQGVKRVTNFNSLYVCTVHVAELTIKLTLTFLTLIKKHSFDLICKKKKKKKKPINSNPNALSSK